MRNEGRSPLLAPRACPRYNRAYISTLPPFTFEGRDAMPEVEIDPDDEWHVGDTKV
jgi:hypothetical protein